MCTWGDDGVKLRGRVVLDQAWLAAMRAAPRIVENELRRGLRRAVRAARDHIRAIAPVGKQGRPGRRPGRLRKFIRHKVSKLKGIVFAGTWYGAIQNDGGVIKARLRHSRRVKLMQGHRSGALTKRVKLDKPVRWMQFQVGGRWVRVSEVKLKGIHFMERGFDRSHGDMQDAINEAGHRVAKRVFGGG